MTVRKWVLSQSAPSVLWVLPGLMLPVVPYTDSLDLGGEGQWFRT